MPPSDMPAVLNPADGIIVPANQPVTPEASGPYLGSHCVAGYRSQQMYDAIAQLAAQGPVTLEEAPKIMLLDGTAGPGARPRPDRGGAER